MTKNRFANIILITLAVVAVIQTGGLWLGQTKSHGLFYSRLDTLFSSDTSSKKYYTFLEPESSAIGLGDNRYIIVYGTNDGLNKNIASSLETVFSSGTLIGTSEISPALFSEKSIVLNYPFSVSSVEFLKGFSSSGDFFVSAFNYFDGIILSPSYSRKGYTSVSFLNSQDQTCCSVSLEDDTVNSLLRSVIDGADADSSLIYISSAESGFNIFKNNVFLPQWTEDDYLYSSVTAENACADESGTVSTATISSMVSPLFSDKGADSFRIDTNGVHLYYTDDTVVKYYPNGILEYFSYAKTDARQSLASAYNACISFIKNDSSIATDIYLADAEATTEGLVFRFDYCVNNLPVTLSPELKESLGVKSAIEAVVNGNTVKKYRKYSYNFRLSPDEDMSANVDFLSEINRVIISAQGNSTTSVQISDIRLSYYCSEESICPLKWITDINNTGYIGDTYVAPYKEADTVEP